MRYPQGRRRSECSVKETVRYLISLLRAVNRILTIPRVKISITIRVDKRTFLSRVPELILLTMLWYKIRIYYLQKLEQ